MSDVSVLETSVIYTQQLFALHVLKEVLFIKW